MQEKIEVSLRQSGKQTTTLTVEKSEKVESVKQKIEELCEIPPAQQRLVYKGKMLRDEDTIASLGVANGHVFNLIRKASVTTGNSTADSRPAAATARPSTTRMSPGADMFPTNPMPGTGQEMDMGNLMQAMSSLSANMPQFGEDAMKQMVEDPNFQNSMKYLFSNPEALQELFRQNPLLNEMMNNNPFVRSVMESPAVLRGLMSPEILNVSLRFQQRMAEQQQQAQETGQAPEMDMDSMMRQAMEVLGENPGTRDQLLSTLSQAQSAMSGVSSSERIQVPSQTQNTNRPPEEAFQNQLRQLEEMGFIDREANVQALEATSGSVDQSIAWLLENGFGNG
eukprot:GHVP01011462.1.p2 GENE.GHVP01011462.1~~GHVP01011462.1.p2  ORF type:complete len:338 (-),score=75.82 GHVP01011462.1:864-1877(-)